MAIYRLPFDDDGAWQGGGNWDDPAGGHGPDQAYAFDFGHPTGGNVRAARSGVVADFRNDVDFNTYNWTEEDWKKYLEKYPNDERSSIGGGSHVLVRHSDDTVAAYCHLTANKTFITKKGQWVAQGEVIGLSGKTGSAGGPHLHFDLRVFWNSADDLGPTIPVQFEDKNHVSWRPKQGDALASNNSILRQEEWRWCPKCQGLYFSGKPIQGSVGGTCPAGGAHVHGGSANYILVFNSSAPGQEGWSWCSKCQGLFFGAIPSLGNMGGVCPAGGVHSKTASGKYVLANSSNAPGQADWHWCSSCQGLFFGASQGSKCPTGNEHTKAGTGSYRLVMMGNGDAQRDWHWCNKCQGLFFGGNPGSKCPGGGEHHQTGGGGYVLLSDYTSSNVPGQADWRWCHKCQGLFFGGNPGSKCPAGGEHSKTGSGDYVLVNKSNAPGQADWHWCNKCQGLFFGGNPGSKCPAGGGHNKMGVGSYSLLV